jgi:3'(2'), 5'-bisphosphate nucleotidase
MEWDIAAGQAILEELGGEIRDVSSGEKLVYNKANLLNPHFIAKSYAFIQQHVTTL